MRSLLCRALVSGHIGFSNKDYVESKTDWFAQRNEFRTEMETMEKGELNEFLKVLHGRKKTEDITKKSNAHLYQSGHCQAPTQQVN